MRLLFLASPTESDSQRRSNNPNIAKKEMRVHLLYSLLLGLIRSLTAL